MPLNVGTDMNKKKQTRRSREKYPALKRELNLKSRSEEIDFDYLHKLNDEEKEWLNKFSSEWINASFEKEEPKKKGKRRKFKNLHKTDKQKKSCYNRNNARNRCIVTKAKASGKFHYIEDVISSEEEMNERLQDLFERRDESDDGGG